MAGEPQVGQTMTGPDGQLRMWQPDTTNQDNFAYLGTNSGFQTADEAAMADQMSGQGSWVPASFAHQNGLNPLKLIGLMAAAGAGGSALAGGLPALFGAGGAAAGAGAGTGAAVGGSLPAAVSGLPAGLLGASGVGATSLGAGAGLGSAGAAGAGLGAATGLPAASASLPAGLTGGSALGGSVPTFYASTVAPASVAGGIPTLAGTGPASTGSILFGSDKFGLNAAPSASGLFSQIAGAIKPYAGLLGAGIGGATDAAAAGRGTENEFNLRNASLGIQGQSALEQELMNRAALEASQRKGNLSDLYKQSVAQNPARSPYDTNGAPPVSDAYMQALASLASQGSAQLANAPKYSASNMAPLQPFQSPTYKGPGLLEKIGNVAGPVLSGFGGLLKKVV